MWMGLFILKESFPILNAMFLFSVVNFNGFDPPFTHLGGSPNAKDTPNVKKRHRRAKSGTNKGGGGAGAAGDDGNDSDGYEFMIVSLDNKTWHFEAPSTEVSSASGYTAHAHSVTFRQ